MLKALFLVNLILFVSARGKGGSTPTPSPYDAVGKCDRAKKAIDTNFNIDNVANKGNYYYLFANSVSTYVTCATAHINKDKNGKYTGYATLYTSGNNPPTQLSYTLPTNQPGLIFEDLKVGNGKNAQTYHFKLYIDNYDDKLGVMSYTRCSDSGTKTTDVRSVVIIATNKNNQAAITQAKYFVNQGNTKGLTPWTNPRQLATNCN